MRKKITSQYGTTFKVPRSFRERKAKKLYSAKGITFCKFCSNFLWHSKTCTVPDCENNGIKQE